jgi:hypothetical protein
VEGASKRTELVSKSFAAMSARFLEVATYFGTESPTPQHFFGIISIFKRDLQRAHDENVIQQKKTAKARKETEAEAETEDAPQ